MKRGRALRHAAAPWSRGHAPQVLLAVCAALRAQVPLDGVIVWGSASVSLQHISGESVPLPLERGAEVPAGSRNLDGLLVLRVLAGVEESTPARIARMAAQAQVSPGLSAL